MVVLFDVCGRRDFLTRLALQLKSYHISISGAQHLRAGPDFGLVRLAGRMSALERAQEAEAPGGAHGLDAFQFRRHARLAGAPRQGGGVTKRRFKLKNSLYCT